MDLTALNPMQRQAAETLEGPVLILAGAGSGKTRTVTYRIANLMDRGVQPWHILALTFTNKASKEMKERISALVGKDKSVRLWMGTFHSIFLKILYNEVDKIGFQPNFTIYDTGQTESLLKSIIKDNSLHLFMVLLYIFNGSASV